jgi:hypothetical protein
MQESDYSNYPYNQNINPNNNEVFIPPPKFTFWGLIKGTFGLIWEQPLIIFGFSVISFLPLIPIELVDYYISDSIAILFFLQLVSMMFTMACQGATAKAVIQLEYQDSYDFMECLKRGFSKNLSFILLIIIFAIAFFIIIFILSILTVFIPFFVIILPFTFFILLYLGSIYSLTINICVIENISITASLGRSYELTKGHIIKIMLFFILLILITITLLAIILSDTINSFSFSDPKGLQSLADNYKITLLSNLTFFFLTVITNSALAIIYKNTTMVSDTRKIDAYSDVFS